MTEINSNIVKLTNNCSGYGHTHSEEVPETFSNNFIGEINNAATYAPSFLSVTNRFDYSKLEGLVFSGNIAKETEQLELEEAKILDLTSNKTREYSISALGDFKSKKIDFEKYTGIKTHTKQTTNISNILSSIQYSDKYDTTAQQTIIAGGIQKLANWLDESIANYEEQVATGKNRGDSEVKLSYLLKLRKEIENCDFPIGFGNDEIFEKYTEEDSIVIGGYNKTTTAGEYLNPTYNPEENNSIINYKDQSIIFNAAAFIQDRKYNSEDELINAIENGEFDEIKEALINGTITKSEIKQVYTDVIMASDDVYNNFRQVYFASSLAKELIRAAHITDESVLLNTKELIEDDFKNQLIYSHWNNSTLNALGTIVQGIDLNSLTYKDVFMQTGEYSGIGFIDYLAYNQHSSSKDNVLQKGTEENLEYGSYYYFFNGNSTDQSQKVLMNFVV